MKTLSVLVPGRFEDAYLYMGRLVVVTEEQTLRFYNMTPLIEQVESRFQEAIPVLTWMFLRNDWLATSQFSTLMKSPELHKSFFSLFDRLPSFCVPENPASCVELEDDLRINATVVLDLRLYGRRIYIGADNGVYHLDFDWHSDPVEPTSSTEKRLDTRCVSLSAKYGAMNASCGDDGLFTSINDFRWRRQLPTLVKLSDRSLRTAWLNYDLVNYSSYSEPFLLRGREEEVPDTDYPERRVLVALGEETLPFTDIYSDLFSKFDVHPDTIQFAFNSRNTVFVHTIQGHLYTIGVRNPRQGHPRVRFTRDYEYSGGRILNAQFTRYGTVVESENSVSLFANGRWFELFKGEVLSVRAFAASKRYQNVVSMVREDGVLLIALADEEAFRP